MLSARVLEQLLRDTPLKPFLLKTAWSGLSTDARLQLIDAHRSGDEPFTPDCLLKLALDDPQPIVRYWALLGASLRSPINQDSPLFKSFAPTDEELKIAEKARADTHPLVNAATQQPRLLFDVSDLLKGPQLVRLVNIRNSKSLWFSRFVEFLESAVDGKTMPTAEIAGCLIEYLASASFKRIPIENMSDDGDFHFSNTEAMNALWALTSRADRLAGIIAWRAPLRIERENMGVAELAKLPESVIKTVVVRREPAAIALRSHVLANPKHFSKHLVEEAGKANEPSEYGEPDEAEKRAYRIEHAATEQEALMETLAALRVEVAAVQSEVAALKEQMEPRKKRALFG